MKKMIIALSLFLGQQIFAAETIKLVVADSFPPLMWNDNGKLKGIALELGKAILEKAGYKVEVEGCPWARCQKLAEEEGAFITGFSKNEERLQKFEFSDVTMYDDVVIATKKGKEFPFKKDEDLKDKKIGSALGVSYGDRYERLKKIFKLVNDNDDAARVKVLNEKDRIDGGVFSLGTAGVAYAVKMAGLNMADFSVLPDPIDRDPNYLATGKKTKNVAEKIKKINEAIKALNANGTITKITKMTF